MKALLIVVGIACAAFLVYQVAFAKSGPVVAYEEFAENVVRGNFPGAEPYHDGPAVKKSLRDKWSYTPRGMEAFHGATYDIHSTAKGNDGVMLDVTMKVRFDPPGVHSAMGGTWASEFRHQVTVAKRDGEWKVVAFESEHLRTGEMARSAMGR